MSRDDSFVAKERRSINLRDLEHLIQYADRLSKLHDANTTHIDISAVVASLDGYVIGEIWWNSEAEMYQVDFARWGESLG